MEISPRPMLRGLPAGDSSTATGNHEEFAACNWEARSSQPEWSLNKRSPLSVIAYGA